LQQVKDKLQSEITPTESQGGLLQQVKDQIDQSKSQKIDDKPSEDLLQQVKDQLDSKTQKIDEDGGGLLQQVKDKLDESKTDETQESGGGLLQQVKDKLEESKTDETRESGGLLQQVKDKLIPSVEEESPIEFKYLENIDRFKINFIDENITHLVLSEQLAYVLGFEKEAREEIGNGAIGKYGVDLNGGFSSFAVYANGLTRSVILGNTLSSLLRIVAVESHHGGIIEKIYDHPMFIPVLPREINEIEIDLRWMNGNYVPFEYGTVMVTLVFKKVINF
jgi:hypothetical protein